IRQIILLAYNDAKITLRNNAMKKLWLLSFLIPILSGCFHSNLNSATNPPSQEVQLCTELKRNIIFNKTSTPSIGTASATQYTQMINLYDKYGCSKLDQISK
ncbi:MAG TPA: hypothetical protein DEA62_01135, partial [Coxiellaceae bacterium]|nr:hypothetical protein [Coxiellaceae bacterium]